MPKRIVEIVDPHPNVIHCNINIAHHQLRDLVQPAGEKGKVLFVNGLKIDCADFNTKKVIFSIGEAAHLWSLIFYSLSLLLGHSGTDKCVSLSLGDLATKPDTVSPLQLSLPSTLPQSA